MAKERIQYMNLLSQAKKRWTELPAEAKDLVLARHAAGARAFDLLWRVIKRIEEKHHIDVKGILREERWNQGFAMGQELAKKSEGNGIKDLYNAFFAQFEGKGSRVWFELNDLRQHHWTLECPNLEHFKAFGRTDEEIKEMGPYFCLQDDAIIKGFNSNFEVSAPTRILQGDDHCTWIIEDHAGKAEPIPEGGLRSPEEIP